MHTRLQQARAHAKIEKAAAKRMAKTGETRRQCFLRDMIEICEHLTDPSAKQRHINEYNSINGIKWGDVK